LLLGLFGYAHACILYLESKTDIIFRIYVV